MRFQRGVRRALLNADLPVGVVRTKAGHLRYTSPREVRGKYVHRVVVDALLAETPYSVRCLLPFPYEIHHQDYNKENNDPSNLVLIDIAFHSVMTADRPRRFNGQFGMRFEPKWRPEPEWVLFDKNVVSADGDDGVPF